jgi:hypothetical protein
MALNNYSAWEIAERLSKAQRRMVLESRPDDITGEEGTGVEIRGAEYRTARSLRELGLGRYTHGSSISDMYWNDGFGLQVRVALRAGASVRREAA